MQNEKTDFPKREKRTAKSCCLLTLAVGLACFILVTGALACLVIADTASLKGEGYTLSRLTKRYKVACQFLWFDFKDWVSRKASKSSPSEPESMQVPADSPESESESEPESEP